MDTLTPEQRGKRMSLIRSKDTKPEKALRSALHALGYRYRTHSSDLPGRPDVVFPGRKKVIFIHGCFWHGHQGCKIAHIPKSRADFWQAKFERNQARDMKNLLHLTRLGWEVLVVWECELASLAEVIGKVASFLGPRRRAQ